MWTVGISSSGATPQKPMTRAYSAVRRWLELDYPTALTRSAWAAKFTGAMRSVRLSCRSEPTRPHAGGAGDALSRQRDLVVDEPGAFGVHGVREGSAAVFLRFLRRDPVGPPPRVSDRRQPSRASVETRDPVAQGTPTRSALVFLPGWDLNPDEFLTHDVKANAGRASEPS